MEFGNVMNLALTRTPGEEVHLIAMIFDQATKFKSFPSSRSNMDAKLLLAL
jgi:hypothetical protein